MKPRNFPGFFMLCLFASASHAQKSSLKISKLIEKDGAVMPDEFLGESNGIPIH
jgi:hypothetical protein